MSVEGIGSENFTQDIYPAYLEEEPTPNWEGRGVQELLPQEPASLQAH